MSRSPVFRNVILLVCFLGLTACRDLVDEVNEAIQASQGDLQAKRALTLAESSLPILQRIDVAIGVRKETLERLKEPLLKALNESKTAQENGLAFKDAAFLFGEQHLGLGVLFVKTFPDLVVEGNLQASAFVGSTGNALLWNLYADGFELTKVDGSPEVIQDAAQQLIAELNNLLPLMNAVLDEVVNDDPSKAVLLSLGEKGLIDVQLADESSDDFEFDPKLIQTGLTTTASAVLIDEKGIFVVGQVEFVAPGQVSEALPVFPDDDELVRISASDVQARVAAYRSAVTALVGGATGGEFSPLVKLQKTGIGVTKAALTRLINFTLVQGQVSGTAIFNKPYTNSSDITFKIGERDCKQYFDGCDYKPICEGNRCLQEVSEPVQTTCEVGFCATFGLVGCLLRGVREETCTRMQLVTRPIVDATCDAFRAHDQLYGGALCSIASNVDKAICDVDANLRKSLCDVEQELRRFYASNPVAVVTATAHPDVRLKASVSDASISSDLLSFEGTIAASGGGRIKASVGYDRKNYADAMVIPPAISLGLACAVDWKESIDIAVAADPLQERVKFAGAWTTKPDKTLSLVFTQMEAKTAFADFRPPPLVELFLGKPQVALNCPLMGVGAALFGSAEAIFTQEDARQILPLLTGEDFPIELKDNRFSLDLEPIKLCADFKEKDCATPLVILAAEESAASIVYIEQ